MGAEQFMTKAKGKTAQEAFNAAKEEAYYDHGHRGYTGTIAEKLGFVMACTKTPGCPEERNKTKMAYAVAEGIADEAEWVDKRDIRQYNDKWGAALCLQIDKDTWLFFGIASS